MGKTRWNNLLDGSKVHHEMSKIIRAAVVILLAPIAVITFYWWGYKYYSSVIN